MDLVELGEFSASVLRRASVARGVFTDRELATCARGPRRHERLAARFAAKEAAFKAVGTGWGNGVTWHDAEVVSGARGEPTLVVRGALLRYARARGGTRFHVSLTHSGGFAGAFVVLAR
jgi:holo-[acyl-carrier protein] synthase